MSNFFFLLNIELAVLEMCFEENGLLRVEDLTSISLLHERHVNGSFLKAPSFYCYVSEAMRRTIYLILSSMNWKAFLISSLSAFCGRLPMIR